MGNRRAWYRQWRRQAGRHAGKRRRLSASLCLVIASPPPPRPPGAGLSFVPFLNEGPVTTSAAVDGGEVFRLGLKQGRATVDEPKM